MYNSYCNETIESGAVIPATGHDYQAGVCSACGEKAPSKGLKFTLNDDAQSDCVSGIGACTDTDIVIPSVHDGLPVTSIGGAAFLGCSSLTSITFSGTKAQWDAIEKVDDWNYNTGNYTIHCTDGDIQK